jgi:hypothetical protein
MNHLSGCKAIQIRQALANSSRRVHDRHDIDRRSAAYVKRLREYQEAMRAVWGKGHD